MRNASISRRKFIGTTAAAAAVSMVPFNFSFASGGKKPNSKVNGVQLGITTYSYRAISHSLEEVLEYVLKAGVNALEMRSVLEEGLGIPAGPGRGGRADLSDKDKAERAKAADAAREAQRKWRLSLPMQKYVDVRKMYNNAGVDIHIAKFVPSSWSDEEIDYAYNAANALGAYGITDEASVVACKRLGKFAEKHKSLAIYHTHGQFGEPGFDIDTLLSYSPSNRLNLDIGHYWGATGKHPNDVIIKYHDRIPMIHVKDKTGPKNPTPNANRQFGKGETPIADVLLLLKKEKWPIDCFVELEYDIPSDSDPVKETIKCIDYMRNILE
ncbi:MAG: TIM barrel protein [Prolixibacteraceae bacterium]